ncbi:MAG: prepilin-type N-terminal cleavage/methylation domain-containing protein [Caldimonas sp.]
MMARHRERGLSLVELLVGAAIGLIVVAAAGSVVAAHQVAARQVQLEARLMQDLRSAAELVARDLRRAGHWAAAASGVRRGDEPGAVNPHAAIAPASGAAGVVTLSFSTGAGDPLIVNAAERFGFRLRNGAIEVQLGERNWQALSDPGTVVVTAFRVVARIDEAALETFCATVCAAGSTTCPPRQQVRSYEITVAGRSVADPLLARELRSAVRARNDVVVGNCEA